MQQSVAVSWGIVAIIFVGATAVGGSNIRRYSALERRVLTAETQAAERTTEVEGLTHQIQSLRSQLASAKTELTMAKRSLKTTQSLLQDAAIETRAVNDLAEQQRREMSTLKTCLAGAAQALQYLSVKDNYRALWVMTSVDRDCREAQALMAGN
jgi:chromosome segregation ATPase